MDHDRHPSPSRDDNDDDENEVEVIIQSSPPPDRPQRRRRRSTTTTATTSSFCCTNAVRTDWTTSSSFLPRVWVTTSTTGDDDVVGVTSSLHNDSLASNKHSLDHASDALAYLVQEAQEEEQEEQNEAETGTGGAPNQGRNNALPPQSQCLVQWASTMDLEWVSQKRVRRCQSPIPPLLPPSSSSSSSLPVRNNNPLPTALLCSSNDDNNNENHQDTTCARSDPTNRIEQVRGKNVDDDHDDDEVEFLWTLALSPPRNQQQGQQRQTSLPPQQAHDEMGDGQTKGFAQNAHIARPPPKTTTASATTTNAFISERDRHGFNVETPRIGSTFPASSQPPQNLDTEQMNPSSNQTVAASVESGRHGFVTDCVVATTTTTTITPTPRRPRLERDVRVASSSSSTTTLSFSLVQSAHVQTLAEMAYTIWRDARWKVGGRECVLAEDGGKDVDFLAVVWLQRLYRPSPPVPPPPLQSRMDRDYNNYSYYYCGCTCLLCRKRQQQYEVQHHRLKQSQEEEDMEDSATDMLMTSMEDDAAADDDADTDTKLRGKRGRQTDNLALWTMNQQSHLPEESGNDDQNTTTTNNNNNYNVNNKCDVDKNDDYIDDEKVRWLHLYCRLFYRRGPWFRLDDIYERYYRPNTTPKPWRSGAASGGGGANNDDDDDNSTPQHRHQEKAPLNHDDDEEMEMNEEEVENHSIPRTPSGSVFFNSNNNSHITPQGHAVKHNMHTSNNIIINKVATTPTPLRAVFRTNAFAAHLVRVEKLFQDLNQLSVTGLIRSFHGEEECGRTVGQSVISAEMRTALLGKLGLKTTKQSSFSSCTSGNRGRSNNNTNNNSSHHARSNGTPSMKKATTNQVWRQMNQQQSILATMMPHSSSSSLHSQSLGQDKKSQRRLLPVVKHVNSLVLEKLASDILCSCCDLSGDNKWGRGTGGSSLPSRALWKEHGGTILQHLKRLAYVGNGIHQFNSNNGSTTRREHHHHDIPSTCWRLQECPALTLRRCCRLYLCANSGPGNMRSDASNGWKSLQDLHCYGNDDDQHHHHWHHADRSTRTFPFQDKIQPPGVHTWHQVQYPGSMVRFGLTSALFQQAYQPLSLTVDQDDNNNNTAIEDDKSKRNPSDYGVFSSVASFHAWEMCVELRAYVDYWIELYELARYEARQQERRQKSEQDTQNHPQHQQQPSTKNGVAGRKFQVPKQMGIVPAMGGTDASVDFLKLLTTEGLDLILTKFLAAFQLRPEQVLSLTDSVRQNVKASIVDYLPLPGQPTECENVLVTLAIVIRHLLQVRVAMMKPNEVSRMISMPWLRHLWWEACLAYILWDIIPLLERLELYSLTIPCLQVLLYGGVSAAVPESNTDADSDSAGVTTEHVSHPLALCWLSRRARGKACDRLVIDQTHWNRQVKHQCQSTEAAIAAQEEGKEKNEKKQGKQQKSRRKSIRAKETCIRDTAVATQLSRLCESILNVVVPTSQIPFAALRGIARRLKRPLSESLSGTYCLEAQELGLRLGNSNNKPDSAMEEKAASKVENGKRYTDWSPLTDKAVANALVTDRATETESTMTAGARCAYIGHDDATLNVEQLAMEYYRIGTLPNSTNSDDDNDTNGGHNMLLKVGGWVGWHDEGGHIRAIFRILCSAPLLGMDGGCSSDPRQYNGTARHHTIHLTPYQGAPFDLHVGFAQWSPLQQRPIDAQVEEAIPSFYHRQRQRIEQYLTELTNTSPQGICNAMHDAVACRWAYAVHSGNRDPLLERDRQNFRTLSLIAAGCGGPQLASIFRCLLFDYRHYSGGLPDLLLVRACYVHHDGNKTEAACFADLSDWIGESLSQEHLAEQEALSIAAMVADEEFLGCSKVGDSGGGGGGRSDRRRSGSTSKKSTRAPPKQYFSMVGLPERLVLSHRGIEVVPECMMVEVKSSNDRLDGRQEDWLNILDRKGNARVCKFESTMSSSQKTRKRPHPQPPPPAAEE